MICELPSLTRRVGAGGLQTRNVSEGPQTRSNYWTTSPLRNNRHNRSPENLLAFGFLKQNFHSEVRFCEPWQGPHSKVPA